jgi:hypothetical protein
VKKLVVEFGEFKGNKTISLKNTSTDKFSFTFGLGKAKLIVENFEAIKKFVDDNTIGQKEVIKDV